MTVIGLLLAAAGAYLCVSMICTASHMPTKSSWTISLLVAGTFAASVGVVVTSLSGDLDSAFRFACGTAVLLLGQVVWRLSHGLDPNGAAKTLRGHDANVG